MKKFLEEFKTFALEGNVMDMAVGVIIGAAFQAILVSDIISPLLGSFAGMNFDTLSVSINAATLAYGKFITAVINFLIMAFVLFMIVKTINKISSMFHEEKVEESKPEKSDELIALEKIVSLLEEKK